MKEKCDVNIKIKNYKDIMQGIENTQNILGKSIQRANKDFIKRAPGWIDQEIRKEYTIKKKDVAASIKSKKAIGSIKIGNITADNVEIEYQGRLLTPVHFQMTPKKRPAKKKYKVKAAIKKGTKKTLSDPSNTFLADNGAGTEIPFQRVGDDSYPIRAVKTLSVPQMVTSKTTAPKIKKRINVEMDKRIRHHISRQIKMINKSK